MALDVSITSLRTDEDYTPLVSRRHGGLVDPKRDRTRGSGAPGVTRGGSSPIRTNETPVITQTKYIIDPEIDIIKTSTGQLEVDSRMENTEAIVGEQYLTESIKYDIDEGSDGTTWRIKTKPISDVTVDTAIVTYPIKLKIGDIIISKKATSPLTESKLVVSNVVENASTAYVECLKSTQVGSDPCIGDTFARIGSTTDASRRGVIEFNTPYPGPYMEIREGVETTDTSGNIKVRLGRLDDIIDTQAGLDGTQVNYYGLYTDNAHLKGTIYSNSGTIAGWTLSDTSLVSPADPDGYYTTLSAAKYSMHLSSGTEIFNIISDDGRANAILSMTDSNNDTFSIWPNKMEMNDDVILSWATDVSTETVSRLWTGLQIEGAIYQDTGVLRTAGTHNIISNCVAGQAYQISVWESSINAPDTAEYASGTIMIVSNDYSDSTVGVFAGTNDTMTIQGINQGASGSGLCTVRINNVNANTETVYTILRTR